jgi:hypothetical protein
MRDSTIGFAAEEFSMGAMVCAAADLFNDELAEDDARLIPALDPDAPITPPTCRSRTAASCASRRVRTAPLACRSAVCPRSWRTRKICLFS